MNEFQINLNMFFGPLDLLYYLVRKNELDLQDIPVAKVTDQYLEYLAILTQLDINAVGDFLALASTLVELKSIYVLPNSEEVEEELEDPRQDLVKQLLAYKQYSDAADALEKRSRHWQQHYPRLSNDLPRGKNPVVEDIREVELWDIVSAYARIAKDQVVTVKQEIIYDDTPISTHMKRIYARLKNEGTLTFQTLFTQEQHRTTILGLFLAVLELVRHEYASVSQKELFGEIEITFRQGNKPLEFADMLDYDSAAA